MDNRDQSILESTVVPHPGEMVMEYLDFNGWSQSDLARRTGLTAKTISEICNRKAPISPSTALAFEKAFQRPAHWWLNLQRQFDEAEARLREHTKSLQWTDWVKNFPLEEMRKLRFSLPEGRSDAESLLTFFGVASPESWTSVWKASAIAYRQTRVFTVREHAVAAWVREIEIVAKDLDVAPFDDKRLWASLDELRGLTRRDAGEIMDPVQNICAQAGIAVVLVQALPSTGISGCARWLNDKRALVGLTLRYRTDDQLWFTLFHEIGHILLHRTKRPFVLDNAVEDLSDRVVDPEMERYETEANRFSADALIPPKAFDAFSRKGLFTNESIHSFAETVGVGPGLVVGRLQYEGILGRHQGNALKQKLNWNSVDER